MHLACFPRSVQSFRWIRYFGKSNSVIAQSRQLSWPSTNTTVGVKRINSSTFYSYADLNFTNRELAVKLPFHVDGTKITLIIYNSSKQRLGKGAVRKLLFDAYMYVTDVIDIAGDGVIPESAEPYQAVTPGAYIRVSAETAGVEKLKWSHLKDSLWGLRQYMVVQGHFFAIRFEIFRMDEGTFYLGDGRVDLASS